jgi:hypothetical protein
VTKTVRTGKAGKGARVETPRTAAAAAQPAGPSDAPLVVVYVAIICCALTAMLVLAVGP